MLEYLSLFALQSCKVFLSFSILDLEAARESVIASRLASLRVFTTKNMQV